jgi:hypothetical protein
MSDPQRCSECGDTKPLNRDGVCEWRLGCEHRVRVQDARFGAVIAQAKRDLSSVLTLEDMGFIVKDEDD